MHSRSARVTRVRLDIVLVKFSREGGQDQYRSWFTLLSDTCRVPATMRSDVGTDEQRALVRLQTSVVQHMHILRHNEVSVRT